MGNEVPCNFVKVPFSPNLFQSTLYREEGCWGWVKETISRIKARRDDTGIRDGSGVGIFGEGGGGNDIKSEQMSPLPRPSVYQNLIVHVECFGCIASWGVGGPFVKVGIREVYAAVQSNFHAVFSPSGSSTSCFFCTIENTKTFFVLYKIVYNKNQESERNLVSKQEISRKGGISETKGGNEREIHPSERIPSATL